MSVITIRGQSGSGAPEIGKRVADKLHIDYVDREIIAEVAERLRMSKGKVKGAEMPLGSLERHIAEALKNSGLGSEGAYKSIWQFPLADTLYLAGLESVIRELAKNQPIVILGRGSRFILGDLPGSFHVLIVAPLELRVKRVMENLKLGKEAAEKEIARVDNSRRDFINRFFGADQQDPACYDLVINTEYLNFEAATSIVVHALPFKE